MTHCQVHLPLSSIMSSKDRKGSDMRLPAETLRAGKSLLYDVCTLKCLSWTEIRSLDLRAQYCQCSGLLARDATHRDVVTFVFRTLWVKAKRARRQQCMWLERCLKIASSAVNTMVAARLDSFRRGRVHWAPGSVLNYVMRFWRGAGSP